MAETPRNTRKLAAGIAAVVLTLSAAGAAVAVNLGTGAELNSPAGKLSATESISQTDPTAPAPTPSTIYVDLTVPVAPAPAAPQATTPTTPATPAPATAAPSVDDSDDDDSYDDGYDDDSYDDDHDEYEDGADDDD